MEALHQIHSTELVHLCSFILHVELDMLKLHSYSPSNAGDRTGKAVSLDSLKFHLSFERPLLGLYGVD